MVLDIDSGFTECMYKEEFAFLPSAIHISSPHLSIISIHQNQLRQLYFNKTSTLPFSMKWLSSLALAAAFAGIVYTEVLDLGDVKQFDPKIVRPPKSYNSLKHSADILDHIACAARRPPNRRHLDQPSRRRKRLQHRSRKGPEGQGRWCP